MSADEDNEVSEFDSIVSIETDQVIKADDFKSTRVEISLMNSKTRLELRNGYRSIIDKKGKKEITEDEALTIQFNEILEKGLMVEVPTDTAEMGHTLMLKVELKKDQEVLQSLNLGARVIKIGLRQEGYDVLEVELTQFDPDEWKAFCGYFSNRQTEIEALFEAMKN